MLRRRVALLLLLLFLACVVLPVAVVRGCDFYDVPRSGRVPGAGPFVLMRRAATGKVERLPLEEYVKGVVAAEMPASFQLEALKAQAVLARTYVLHRMRAFGGAGDPGDSSADISDDPASGQAWLDRDALRARWGLIHFASNWAKISRAVDDTAGLIALFGGEPIEAAYHSTCGGRTESAAEVWQLSLPYLQPVQCAWDGHSPRFEQRLFWSWDDLERRLGPSAGALAATAASSGRKVVEVTSRTAGGRVGRIRVGDLTTSGIALRQDLGLPSAAFEVAETKTGLSLTVHGHGHGVGLCQYGADGMARAGKGWEEIIAHYLPGVEVRPIFRE